MATRDVTVMEGSAMSRILVFCFKLFSSLSFSIRSSTTASSAAMPSKRKPKSFYIQRLECPPDQNGDQLEKKFELLELLELLELIKVLELLELLDWNYILDLHELLDNME